MRDKWWVWRKVLSKRIWDSVDAATACGYYGA